jgi:hypothetical protein
MLDCELFWTPNLANAAANVNRPTGIARNPISFAALLVLFRYLKYDSFITF